MQEAESLEEGQGVAAGGGGAGARLLCLLFCCAGYVKKSAISVMCRWMLGVHGTHVLGTPQT